MAWRLLRGLTPERLIFPRIAAARLVRADPTDPELASAPAPSARGQPGLADTIAEQELTHAVTYADVLGALPPTIRQQ